MSSQQDDLAKQLSEARLVIEHQASEIERSREPQGDDSFSNELRNRLVATAATGVIASETAHRDALFHVVDTAADLINATAAALFLLDEDSEELVFEVALGSKAEEVMKFRVPMGHGLAGYVAATGQPIAVTDASQDPRFARDIAEAIDYIPTTVLCVPLILDYRVIGVIELLDKAGGEPFAARDMETLGRFANLAARTIDESRLTHDMRRLFRSLLADLTPEGSLAQPAMRFADRAADCSENSDAIRLAGLIHELCLRGESARRLAIEMLTSLNRYLAATTAM